MLNPNNRVIRSAPKVFEAYLIEIADGDVGNYEVHNIKAQNRGEAWDSAIALEPNLFQPARMIFLKEIVDEDDIF